MKTSQIWFKGRKSVLKRVNENACEQKLVLEKETIENPTT